MTDVERDALISPCTRYRYWLGRSWDPCAYPLPIIMLNPSTADADIDDPTIRRCMAFARRERFGGIRVFNLFAFRATSPADMKVVADPVGPENDYWINRALDAAAAAGIPVLAAWGTHGAHRARDNYVRGMANMRGARLVCLGATAAGHPRHPLYVKGEQPLEPFPSSQPKERSDGRS